MFEADPLTEAIVILAKLVRLKVARLIAIEKSQARDRHRRQSGARGTRFSRGAIIEAARHACRQGRRCAGRRDGRAFGELPDAVVEILKK
jgi:hypothetical protein